MISTKKGQYLIAFVLFSLLVTSPYHSQSCHTNSLTNNLVKDSPILDFTRSLDYIIVESMKIESDIDFILLGLPGIG
ncbi:unnamed protein product, partial [marine sediment metagenome]